MTFAHQADVYSRVNALAPYADNHFHHFDVGNSSENRK